MVDREISPMKIAVMDEQHTIPTLHHLTSSISFPVLMALEEANMLRPNGLKYELKVYPRNNGLAPPALREVFSLGKSPIMVVQSAGGDGEREVLSESRYLIEYIMREYANNKLTPHSAIDAKRDTFMRDFTVGTLLSKIDLTMPFKAIPSMLPWGLSHIVSGLFSPIVNHFYKDLGDIYKYLEDSFSDQQPWLSGEHFGIADLLAVFPISAAVHGKMAWDVGKYPRLAKWYDMMISRPSYQTALQKGGTFDLATWM